MTGFFNGFNLESTDALRLLAIAIEYWRDGIKDLNTIPALKNLTRHQHSTIEMLSQRMARSPLLTEIVQAFLDTPRLGDRGKLLAAGRDLRDYATYEVEHPRQSVYQDALRAWRDKIPIPLPTHIPADHAERVRQVMAEVEGKTERGLTRRGGEPGTVGGVAESDAESTSDEESNRQAAAKKGKGKKKPKKSAVKSQKKESSQPKKKVSFANREFDAEDSKSDEVSSKEPSVDIDSSESEDSDVNDKKKRPLHAPVRRPGEKAVDNGNIDKTLAVLGKKDVSKLVIEFDTIKEDKKNRGSYISGERVVYNYLDLGHSYPNFNNKDDICALNKWRRQILKRNFGAVRKTRPLWLLSEKKLILDLAAEQLNIKPKLKLDRLANRYNAIQKGVVQKAGERFIAKGKKKEEALEEDRVAPWRTRGSMYAMAKNKWPEVAQLVMDAKLKWEKQDAMKKVVKKESTTDDTDDEDADDEDINSSGDDRETPDPTPEPKPTTKGKVPATTKAKTAMKSPSMSALGQNPLKESSFVGRKRKSETRQKDEAGADADFDALIWDIPEYQDDDNAPPSGSVSKSLKKR